LQHQGNDTAARVISRLSSRRFFTRFIKGTFDMLSRRTFIVTAGSVPVTSLALQSCTAADGSAGYLNEVQRVWQPGSRGVADRALLMRELVRCATLAPSSHNTQCWKFAVTDQGISILPDLTRRCPAVDPDDHHLYVSMGCAAENLVQAALANGLQGEAVFETTPADVLKIKLQPTQPVESPLFKAISERQCTRAEFDGQPISSEDLRLLTLAGSGQGIQLMLMTEKPAMEKVLEYIVQGNTAQMNDAAFIAELKAWIRFNDAEAVRTGDGLFARASGNPSVPRWIASPLFPAFFRTDSENDKYAKHVRSSSGIAIFVSDANDKAHWIETGRCYERFALQAAALGIRNAFLNQPVEVGALRPQFASFLGVGLRRPDLVVRFGRGPELPRSLRRPIQSVLL
jgi:hypothetical protein